MEYSENQLKALDLNRNIIVTAGAGSGKTTVLVKRYLHILIYNPKLMVKNILAITFTEKAAAEMKKRLEGLVKARASRRVGAGTFHSFYYRVVDDWALQIGYRPGITILDQQDKEDIIAHICEDLGYKEKAILKAMRPGKTTAMNEDLRL